MFFDGVDVSPFVDENKLSAEDSAKFIKKFFKGNKKALKQFLERKLIETEITAQYRRGEVSFMSVSQVDMDCFFKNNHLALEIPELDIDINWNKIEPVDYKIAEVNLVQQFIKGFEPDPKKDCGFFAVLKNGDIVSLNSGKTYDPSTKVRGVETTVVIFDKNVGDYTRLFEYKSRKSPFEATGFLVEGTYEKIFFEYKDVFVEIPFCID